MLTKKLYFSPKTFTVVKEIVSQKWFAVRTADTPEGEWKSLENEEIDCIPIDPSGYLIELASRPILRCELDDNVVLWNSAFEY